MFAIRDGLNHKFGDPNYDIKQLALECASKRMYPDILNYDQVVKVTGSFKTPMGCCFLGVYEDENGEQVHDGRNNLGVISLNLPRIALEAKGDESGLLGATGRTSAARTKGPHDPYQRVWKGESPRCAHPVYGRSTAACA